MRLFGLYFKGPYTNLHHPARCLAIHTVNRVQNKSLFPCVSMHDVDTGVISFCLEKAPLLLIVHNFDHSVILFNMYWYWSFKGIW